MKTNKPLPLPVDITDINNLVNGFVNVELFKFKFLTWNTNTNNEHFVNDFANDFVNNFVNKPPKPLGDEIVKRLSIKMRI